MAEVCLKLEALSSRSSHQDRGLDLIKDVRYIYLGKSLSG